MRSILYLIVSLGAITAISSSGEDERIARRGGLVQKPPTGYVSVINVDGAVTEDAYRRFTLCQNGCVSPFLKFCTADKFDIQNASSMLAASGGAAAIFVVDDAGLPMSLIAVESKWGLVNVAPLKLDKPSEKVLADRTDKMFTRVTTLTLGGGNQEAPVSALKSVVCLEDLDQIKGRSIAMLNVAPLMNHLQKIGIEQGYETTYREACQQGWAPVPTNDIQRAIWEKVHTPPTNPLKIEFDPATQKGKVTK